MGENFNRCMEVELQLCRALGMEHYFSKKFRGLFYEIASGYSVSKASEKYSHAILKKALLESIDRLSQRKSLLTTEQSILTFHKNTLSLDYANVEDCYSATQGMMNILDKYGI